MSDIDEIQKRAKEFLEKRRFERFRASLVVRIRVISPSEKMSLIKISGRRLWQPFITLPQADA